jgi:hypothetical protein
VAGDYVDLHSFTLKRLDHSVMALTPCRIAVVPEGREPTRTATVRREPFRTTSKRSRSPAFIAATSRVRRAEFSIRRPLTCNRISPARRPARSAGAPGVYRWSPQRGRRDLRCRRNCQRRRAVRPMVD